LTNSIHVLLIGSPFDPVTLTVTAQKSFPLAGEELSRRQMPANTGAAYAWKLIEKSLV
jgi:hypothetical protein